MSLIDSVVNTLQGTGIVTGHIRFVDRPAATDTVVAEFNEPTMGFAVYDALGVEALVSAVSAEDCEGFRFALLPTGAATPYDIRKRIEDWAGVARSDEAIVLGQLGDQVTWRRDRLMLIGDPARTREILRAVIEFAYYEGNLHRMEREVDTYLRAAENDISLTHQVTDSDLARWPRANEGVKLATLLRMHYVRLETRLERPSSNLAGPARRLVAELALQVDVADRLVAVDDRIEVLQDLYESATDRLSEYSYFRREYRLEVGIIIVLVVEVIAIIWEITLLTRAGR